MNAFLDTRILALVLAGGKGSRLEVLTDQRAKPAVPFAGSFRLIDIPLSNLKHSDISDVWIVEQYQPHSLNEQLANGRPWDLDRTHGGLRVLPPYEGDGPREGFAQGNADAIYQHLHLLRQFEPDLLLVLSSDQVYHLNYSRVLAHHIEREAEVTLVTTEVARDEASRFSVVQTDGDGWITDFAYKPDEPQSSTVGAEIFVFNADLLFDLLEKLSEEGEGEELGDYGDELLPRLVERGRVAAFPLDGYWRDVGTVASYWQAHMDLLGEKPVFVPDDPQWPLLTREPQRLPAHIYESATVDDSLIAPGCVIKGYVECSVLGPGVVVEEGAKVRESILMQNVHVKANAKVDCAIVDQQVTVGEGATVGRLCNGKPGEEGAGVTLVGREAAIEANEQIEAGARVKGTQESSPA